MNNHDLDNLIRESLPAEPSREQLARLEDFWREQSNSIQLDDKSRLRLARPAVCWAAAVAMTVLVAIITSLCLWRAERTLEAVALTHPEKIEPTSPANQHHEQSNDIVSVESPPKKDSLSAGRPATNYERILFVASTRKSVAARQSTAVAKIDKAIEQLVLNTENTDSEANAKRLARTLHSTQYDTEGLLLRRLQRSKDNKKLAVVRLLAACGTQRSTLPLLRLSKREAFQSEALTAIERIVGVERLGQFALRTDDRCVRAAIFKRLLSADSEPALLGYLRFVRSDSLGAEALAAAHAVSGPLLQRLLALLKDDDVSTRLAAAMVLGHANGPEVSAALIELVTKEITHQSSPAEDWNPTEAWIAIMACRGRKTEEFLFYVQCHPKLLGQYNRARARLAQITL